jgi:hypothetical protein
MTELIKKYLITDKGRVNPNLYRESWWEKRDIIWLRDEILSKTDFLPEDSTWVQRLWHCTRVVYEIPECKNSQCDEKCNFLDGYYQKYCSLKCHNNDPCVIRTRKITMSNRYGAPTTLQSAVLRKKVAETNLCKYGYENPLSNKEIQNKVKKTNIEKYGHENPFGNADVYAKGRHTMQVKYGAPHTLQSPELSSKVEQTVLLKYGVNNAMQSQEVREVTERTNIERYGHSVPSKSENVKQNIINTNIERYGHPSPLLNSDIKAKVRETNLKIYGSEHPSSSRSVQDKIKEAHARNRADKNFIHGSHKHVNSAFLEILKDDKTFMEMVEKYGYMKLSDISNLAVSTICNRALKIEPTKKVVSSFEKSIKTDIVSGIEVLENSRKVISPLELDFYFPDYNMAIECNGSYWHSELNGKGKYYHLNKTKLCEEKEIQLIHIWEHDWIKKPELIKQRLLTKLGKTEKVYARKTQLVKLQIKPASDFLNQYHLQGTCPASIRYALYECDELVAVMTFGKSRFNKKYEWELLRYCSTKQVIGGASKLFKHFVREHNPKTVVSYSDKMWNTGAVYEKLGFEYSHTSSPSYYYTKNYVDFENRVAYQKHKLEKKLDYFDSNLTEWENMQANGYDRIWDCGNDVWEYWDK